MKTGAGSGKVGEADAGRKADKGGGEADTGRGKPASESGRVREKAC